MIRQGVNLKLSGVEQLIDKIIEKKEIWEVSKTKINMVYCAYIGDLLSLCASFFTLIFLPISCYKVVFLWSI